MNLFDSSKVSARETDMDSVLSGIKVLDLTNVYSGPYCTMLLREMGAEVIKVERPISGDVIRMDAPLNKGLESGLFIILNRGKKSVTLDLKSEKGRQICLDLVKKVDVLVENFSPGTMDKLKLSSKELCALNPSLVYASISAYGQTGPRRDFPGFDPIAQAMGGLTSVSGQPDGPPTKCAVSIADFGTGLYTAYAIMSALFYRQRTGKGQVIDMALQDCIWALTSMEFSPTYFISGKIPQRLGNGHISTTPGNLYAAKDGWVIISAGILSQVHRLYTAMGRQDLIDTPMGANQATRIKYKDQIDQIVGDWLKVRPTKEIAEILRKADVPYAIVPTFDQVCHDEQLMSRGMITEVEQPISGKITVPGSVFKLSKTPGDVHNFAPYLGQFNQEIYSGLLGFSDQEIEELSNNHVI
jgi:CoA:oxalate CoA-transferase